MAEGPGGKPRGEIADSRWHPEVELKLRASPAGIDRLLGVPPLAFGSGINAPARALESVYFDTKSRALQKAGIALRVRRDGDAFVQTLKIADPDRQAHARLERHDPVDGFVARADALREAGGKTFATVADGDLVPLFTTRIERLAIEVAARPGPAGGRIEVAVDRGVIEAGEGTDDVCEIELELIEGTVADLYHLAQALHRLEPMAIEVRTKSDRGYALAGGRAPAWHKAGAVDLDAGCTLGDAIAAVLAQCFDHWTGNQAAALDGRDIEGVHQMRVGLRRLRAALGFFGPWLPPVQSEWLEREIRWLAKRLGAVRDLDVLLAETIAPVRKARGQDKDLKALADLVRRRQAEAHDALVAAVGSERCTTLVLTFGQWIAEGAWRGPGQGALRRPVAAAARPALDACLAAVMQAGEGFETLDREGRHALRLQIKRLRYAIQFVGGAYGGGRAMLRQLGALQDALGAANDAALAEELLDKAIRGTSDKERRRLNRATGLVAGWWLARSTGHEAELREQWAALRETVPFWREAAPRLKIVSDAP